MSLNQKPRSISRGFRKRKRVQVWLSPDLKRAVDETAAASGEATTSDFIRTLILRTLKRRGYDLTTLSRK